MPKQMQIFIGSASLLAWLMSGEQLCVSSDAAVYNGSLAIALSFAGTCALCMLPRLQQQILNRRMLLPCASISTVTGLVSALVQIDEIKLALFCFQIIAFVPVLISWGNRIGRLPQRETFTFVISSAALAVVIVLILAAAPDVITSFALPLFALGAGVVLAKGDAELRPSACCAERSVSDPGKEHPVKGENSWALPALLCSSACAASLFCGLAAMPYSANSFTVIACSCGIALFLLVLTAALGVWVVPHVRARVWEREQDADRLPAAENGESREEDSSSLLQAALITILALLVCGALSLSLALSNGLVISLGIIVAARNCLLFLCWAILPRYGSDVVGKPHCPLPVLVLACGMFYLHYLGTWLAKTVGLRYWDLVGASSMLIAFIALLAILYMALQIRLLVRATRQDVAGDDEQKPEAPQELTFEEIQEVINARRLEVLEEHNLTGREREVIMMVIDGQTMGGIAEQLFITERTVKFHCKNGYTKLGVHNKKELMQMFSGM